MPADEILLQTARIIRDTVQCGPVSITRETRATDVRGWDSLSHTMIIMALEDGFGVPLPLERVLGLATVGELVDLVGECRAGSLIPPVGDSGNTLEAGSAIPPYNS